MSSENDAMPSTGSLLYSQVFWLSLLFATVASILTLGVWRARNWLSHIPLLDGHLSYATRIRNFEHNGAAMIARGYKEAKDGVFRVTDVNGDDLVIISPDNWLAISRLKDDVLLPARMEFFATPHTKIPLDDPIFYSMVNHEAQYFDPAVPEIAKVLDDAIATSIGAKVSSQDWVALSVQPLMTRIVAEVSWRITMREAFDPRIVSIFIEWEAGAMAFRREIKNVHPQLRTIYVWLFLRQKLSAFETCMQGATILLTPVFKAARADRDRANGRPLTVIEWLVRNVDDRLKTDYEYLTRLILTFNIAYVFTPSPLATTMIYELAFRQDYVPAIHREALEVLGNKAATVTKADVRRLHVLDSFCKETHRFHPNGATNQQRDVRKPITLPCGIILPPKCYFEVVHTAYHHSDPELQDAGQWRGLRYHELRKRSAGSEQPGKQYEWDVSSRDNLSFGFGQHRCPGRTQGTSLIKLIIAKLIILYDLALEEGVNERYPDVCSGRYFRPDPERAIRFRKRA